jgi:hypothetical protein
MKKRVKIKNAVTKIHGIFEISKISATFLADSFRENPTNRTN